MVFWVFLAVEGAALGEDDALHQPDADGAAAVVEERQSDAADGVARPRRPAGRRPGRRRRAGRRRRRRPARRRRHPIRTRV